MAGDPVTSLLLGTIGSHGYSQPCCPQHEVPAPMLGAPIHPEGESQDEHGDPLGYIRLLFLFLFFPLLLMLLMMLLCSVELVVMLCVGIVSFGHCVVRFTA